MKTEDFERLKEICEKEGFEILNESPNDNDKYYVVRSKKVEVKLITYTSIGSRCTFSFEVKNKPYNLNHLGDKLASYLEKLINEEQ